MVLSFVFPLHSGCSENWTAAGIMGLELKLSYGTVTLQLSSALISLYLPLFSFHRLLVPSLFENLSSSSSDIFGALHPVPA